MTTETLTLTDFLLARIAEDEADWGPGGSWWYEPGEPFARRALAECAAKRRILAEHPAPSYIDEPGQRLACDRCSDLGGPYGYDDPENWVDWPCPTLRALASVYADHPDYHEEWKP